MSKHFLKQQEGKRIYAALPEQHTSSKETTALLALVLLADF